MYVSAQQVDRQVHSMPDDEDQDEENNPDHVIREHASHLVDDRCDNSGRQSQRQQTRVGQHVAQPSGDIVQVIRPECDAQCRVLIAASGHQNDADGARRCQHLCQRI